MTCKHTARLFSALAILISSCAAQPPRPALEACRTLDKEVARRKLGGNIQDAITLALNDSSAGLADHSDISLVCPSLLAIDLAENVDTHVIDALAGTESVHAGRRLYYENIVPENGLPASPSLLEFVCRAASLPAVEKIELYHGISPGPPPHYEESSGGDVANAGWMSLIHDDHLGDPPSSKIVAIVDTGIIPEHADLPAIRRFRVIKLPDLSGSCGEEGCCALATDPPSKNDWHATRVAGTIAAKRDGVGVDGLATPAGIIAIDASHVVPGCSALPTIAAGMQCALEHDAAVINFSMEGDTGALSKDLQSVLDQAAGRGVLIVTAAPNDTVSLDDKPYWPAAHKTPTLITATVGGSTANSWDVRGYGRDTVDLAVPIRETNVLSTSEDGKYNNYGATSAAAAIVTGTAISLWSRPEYSSCTAAEIKEILMNESLPVPPPYYRQISALGGVLDFRFLAEQPDPPPNMCAHSIFTDSIPPSQAK